VAILVGYHLLCGHLRKQLLNDKCNWSAIQFRFFNEIPTLLLVSIVFIVVFKNEFSWSIFSIILGGLILLISGTLQWLAKRRKNEAAENN
jgi:putative membrane protein